MIDDDLPEKVGYGRPPKSHQFAKGKSGNPKGRPKGSRNVAKAIELELDGKTTILENGKGLKPKALKLSRAEVVAKALVTKAMKGDIRAIETLMKLLPERFRKPLADANQNQPLDSVEAEVLERFVARRIAKAGGHD